MRTYRDLVNAFRELGLNRNQPVLVHASLSRLEEVRGGAETILGALLSISRGVMAPTFTYKTMIVPEVGPDNNAIEYGSGKDLNRMAEFYRPDLPADPLMGVLPETLRLAPEAKRSAHPILSFAGIQVDDALAAQTLADPLAPIRVLAEQQGIVLLLGVDHTVNTSIHYAEQLAGRKQFIRWALTPQGVRECPHFGGCSDGFEQAAPWLTRWTRTIWLGEVQMRSILLAPMIHSIVDLLKAQPDALLCQKGDARCEAVRQALQGPSRSPEHTGSDLQYV